MSRLIIVSGPTCGGKSTLATYLAEKLQIPLVSKDTIKETLFDTLGIQDKEWSNQLSHVSIALLFSFAEEQLKRGQSVIIESNFQPALHTETIKKLITQYQPTTVELHCFAKPEILLERFKQRVRHPGHGDQERYEDAVNTFTTLERHASLNVGRVIEIDTNDFSKVSYEEILKELVG